MAGKLKPRVLVVEDEAVIAMLIKYILKSNDFDVIATADTGLGALALAEKLSPDVVLMDITLKGEMDGIEAASQMINRWNLPVVFMTSHTDKATYNRAMGIGPAAYVVKPINDQKLLEALTSALAPE